MGIQSWSEKRKMRSREVASPFRLDRDTRAGIWVMRENLFCKDQWGRGSLAEGTASARVRGACREVQGAERRLQPLECCEQGCAGDEGGKRTRAWSCRAFNVKVKSKKTCGLTLPFPLKRLILISMRNYWMALSKEIGSLPSCRLLLLKCFSPIRSFFSTSHGISLGTQATYI